MGPLEESATLSGPSKVVPFRVLGQISELEK